MTGFKSVFFLAAIAGVATVNVNAQIMQAFSDSSCTSMMDLTDAEMSDVSMGMLPDGQCSLYGGLYYFPSCISENNFYCCGSDSSCTYCTAIELQEQCVPGAYGYASSLVFTCASQLIWPSSSSRQLTLPSFASDMYDAASAVASSVYNAAFGVGDQLQAATDTVLNAVGDQLQPVGDQLQAATDTMLNAAQQMPLGNSAPSSVTALPITVYAACAIVSAVLVMAA